MMKINDCVYGECEIKEEILINLINSKPIQRLKGISQFGLPEEYYHLPCFSRFDHSVGVMILLSKLGASLEEQIAGLLHDVSHTAFSHAIDWVFENSLKEDFQDRTLLEVVKGSEIKEILEEHGFNPEKIVDMGGFSLLEKHAPDLCADRVDYTLREMVVLHNKEDADFILKHLVNFQGNMVFDSLDAAKLFSEHYVDFNKNHWSEENSKVRWNILAEILRIALSEEIISMEDFMKDDSSMINTLLDSGNKKILERFDLLKNGFKLEYVKGDQGMIIRKKFRWVDPFVLVEGVLLQFSEIFDDYRETLEEERRLSENPPRIKILK